MRNVLTVFIASPSDLDAERKRAFSIVVEINEALKSIDWSIDLLGWEDTLPGYGRPQALINRDVMRCDLFVGLLWRRWGTRPSHDLKYSSGFEEEYSIAIGRREQSSSPEIWMFFKKVDPAQVADAGAQLQQVIGFRESLTASRTVLFKEFDSPEAWEKLLRTLLYKYVLGIAGAQSPTPEGPSVRTEPPSQVLPNAQDAPSTPAGHQIEVIADSLRPSFEKGDIEAIASDLGDGQEMAFLGVRTYLLSTALIETSGTSLTSLAVHEINTLYVYRDRLQLTRTELQILFRTVIADYSDVKPGWYVFRNEPEEAIENRLYYTVLFNDDLEARKRSFEVLRVAKLSLFDDVKNELTMRALQGLPSALHDDAWAYLVAIVVPEHVEQLKSGDTNAWFAGRLRWLQDWAAAKGDFDTFLSRNPDPQLLTKDQKENLLSAVQTLGEASLNTLKTWPLEVLRGAALRELRRRGVALTEEERANSVEPSNTLLIALGAPMPSEPHETDEERYARLSKEDANTDARPIEWYRVDDAWRYRILVERGLIAREVVRQDISEGFQRVHLESDERFSGEYGEEGVARLRNELAQFDNDICWRYTEQAFLALSLNPTSADVALARQYLTNKLAGTGPVRIVAQCGDASDVDRLVEIVRSDSGETRTEALEGIRKLGSDHIGLPRELLSSSGQRELQRLGFSFTRQSPDDVAMPLLEELLSSEDEALRAASVWELEMRASREQLADILADYTKRSSYYYNVVTWIDRLLYAPEPLSSYYREELHRRTRHLTD